MQTIPHTCNKLKVSFPEDNGKRVIWLLVSLMLAKIYCLTSLKELQVDDSFSPVS
jgi:hypothetical protein